MSGEHLIFWAAVAMLAYAYAGYPLLLLAWAALVARAPAHSNLRAPHEPTVSIIVVVHDEADRVEARLENLLALDYPRERFEIILASDGSSVEGCSPRCRDFR